jgi:MYXO-CTERM domain-containing protein
MPGDLDLSAMPDDTGDAPTIEGAPFSAGPSEAAPFGGSSCSSSSPATGGAVPALVLGLFGVAGVVRRRR